MNTILFLDGSSTSMFLLKLLKKSKFFNIKKIIISSNIKILDKFKLKNNVAIIKTNFKEISKKKISVKNYDIGFSYYDFKIPKYILDGIKIGGVNFHPSYLPYNRGRHSTFWGIVKNTILGASAHWLNSKFDDGDIIYQEKLNHHETQSAKIIYYRQLKLLKKVMLNTISQIENNQIIRIKQNSKKASYHYKSEIKHFTTFKLDSNINNIKLSRIIRGTCFNKKTGIYLHSLNKKFLINSKFKFEKYKKNKRYNLNFFKVFGKLYNKKKIKFTIYLNKIKMIVNSTVYTKNKI